MVLLLRYTALRIGDVAMLAKDRITKDGHRWRIFLRTEKSGKPVFLPIPAELKDAVDILPAPRCADLECKYFFWNGVTSERAVKGIAERTLAAVFKASKVQRAHAHRCRHTLATELLGNWRTWAARTPQCRRGVFGLSSSPSWTILGLPRLQLERKTRSPNSLMLPSWEMA
jgi:integrase